MEAALSGEIMQTVRGSDLCWSVHASAACRASRAMLRP